MGDNYVTELAHTTTRKLTAEVYQRVLLVEILARMSGRDFRIEMAARTSRRTSCLASQRSSYFPCCFIHIVERSSQNTLTRDLVGSSSATCSDSYESELNSVDCTPPGGCRTDLLSKYAGPDMLGDPWQESPQPTHTRAARRQQQLTAALLGRRRQRFRTWR